MTITDAPARGLAEQVAVARKLPSPALARAIRLDARVSQKQVAEELHVDRVTVARWESGDRRPRGELLVRYVELLEALREAAGEGPMNDETGLHARSATDVILITNGSSAPGETRLT